MFAWRAPRRRISSMQVGDGSINIGGIAAGVSAGIVGSVRCVAVAAMTKNLAAELGPKGINVTTVHPGPTRTEGSAAFLQKRAEKLG